MCKYTLTTLLAASMCAAQIHARTLTPAEALCRAQSDTSCPVDARRAPDRTVPLLTVGDDERPAAYVFAREGAGYIIVSADDAAAPVLGYSSTSTFDPSNIPSNMQWWLGLYQQEINSITESADDVTYSASPQAPRAAIDPLIKTKWNQGAPYNGMCPESVNGKSTVTGCVSTAMAQIMNYHRWPLQFDADFSYSYTFQNYPTIYNVWSEKNVKFDWDNMLDTYTDNATDEQKAAVATLMKACGFSVSTVYQETSSGANSALVPQALVNCFGYDDSARAVFRADYGAADWEELIYNSIANEGPVYFSGSNYDVGHAFVCDGYSDGYFHINWGWGGISDGYFLLTALTPSGQGTGGSNSGYNMDCSAIVGLHKAGTDTAFTPDIRCTGTFSIQYLSDKTLSSPSSFINYSSKAISAKFGFRLIDNHTGVIVNTLLGNANTYDPSSGAKGVGFRPVDIPTGASYRVYPVYEYDGVVYNVTCPADQAGYCIISNENGKVQTHAPSVGEYSIDGITFQTPVYQGVFPFIVSATATWSGDMGVCANVAGVFYDQSGNIVARSIPVAVEFAADGAPVALEYVGEKMWRYSSTFNPGDYLFAFAVSDCWDPLSSWTDISERVPVEYLAYTGSATVKIETAMTVADSENVNPDEINIGIDITCSEGIFYDHMIIALWDTNNTYPYNLRDIVSRFDTSNIYIPTGETKRLEITAALPDAQPGEVYYVSCYNSSGGKPIHQQKIVIGDIGGISDILSDGISMTITPNPATDHAEVRAPSAIRGIEVYALSGARVTLPAEISGNTAGIDISVLHPGLYIVNVTCDGGSSALKLIKK